MGLSGLAAPVRPVAPQAVSISSWARPGERTSIAPISPVRVAKQAIAWPRASPHWRTAASNGAREMTGAMAAIGRPQLSRIAIDRRAASRRAKSWSCELVLGGAPKSSIGRAEAATGGSGGRSDRSGRSSASISAADSLPLAVSSMRSGSARSKGLGISAITCPSRRGGMSQPSSALSVSAGAGSRAAAIRVIRLSSPGSG